MILLPHASNDKLKKKLVFNNEESRKKMRSFVRKKYFLSKFGQFFVLESGKYG